MTLGLHLLAGKCVFRPFLQLLRTVSFLTCNVRAILAWPLQMLLATCGPGHVTNPTGSPPSRACPPYKRDRDRARASREGTRQYV